MDLIVRKLRVEFQIYNKNMIIYYVPGTVLGLIMHVNSIDKIPVLLVFSVHWENSHEIDS